MLTTALNPIRLKLFPVPKGLRQDNLVTIRGLEGLKLFPVPKGLRQDNLVTIRGLEGLKLFPVPKGLRRIITFFTHWVIRFEIVPCTEGIKT